MPASRRMPVTAVRREWITPAGEAGAWIALAVGMWLYSYRFDGEFPAYLWGPVAWPRAVLVTIVVLALAQLALRLVVRNRPESVPAVAGASDENRKPEPESGPGRERSRDSSGEFEGTESASGETPPESDAWARILATFALPFLYLFLLPRTGYFVTTPLFLVAYMLAFREHSLKYMIATAALLYAGSLAIFSKLLFVPLPTGNWPGFYDFSNWLLELLHAL